MDDDLRIELRREAVGRLHVHVRGTATLANTLVYWRAIVEAVRKQPASELLLIDELVGPLLTAQDWAALVDEVGPGLGALRIAHVKPRGVGTVEHCVLAAMASGLEAQVFEDVHRASVWLRYSPDDP